MMDTLGCLIDVERDAMTSFFWTFAILTLAGGAIGFVQAHSMPSLIMGGVFSGLLAVATQAIQNQHRWGLLMMIGVSATLDAFFSYRLATTGKLMPALPMIVLSLVAIGLSVKALSASTPKPGDA